MYRIYSLVDGQTSDVAQDLELEEDAFSVFNEEVRKNEEDSLYEVTVVLVDQTDDTIVAEQTVCTGL